METKDKIINLLEDWKVNTHKQELIADDIVCLFNEQSKQMQQRIKELEDCANTLLKWEEKYPPNKIFSHSAIIKISKELEEITARFKTALNNKQL
jgi:hypothetical protein